MRGFTAAIHPFSPHSPAYAPSAAASQHLAFCPPPPLSLQIRGKVSAAID